VSEHENPNPFPSVHPVLASALTKRGYTTLTEVQSSVLRDEARGRDLLVSARTGSGKTVAFGMAFANDLLDASGRASQSRLPEALVIAPTRELALQVSTELVWLYRDTGARIATCVGGMDASRERRTLSQGVQIVVGTPGRLRDHLERGALDLSALKSVVLDEADEMLDMGFREDLEEILDGTPETRHTFLFSATLPRPIEALAKRYQRNAVRISTLGDDRGHSDISYQAMLIAPADIEHAVVNLLRLHEATTAMLFCATRDRVRQLHASLRDRGFSAVALSGEHSQNERNQALQALRDKRARVCVATDVAARGIDLPSLSLVVHVDLPRDADTLQHRSGRTGRAGKKGIAVLLVPYPRRRMTESMLRTARISGEWVTPPSRDDIRTADRARLIETLREPVELEQDDHDIATQLLAERSPQDIAAMLVRTYRARMPEPEELIERGSSPAPDRNDGPRPGFEGSSWFRLNVGRSQNADARWILPLLCRRGHITRTEIGAIRIAGNETQFEVAAGAARRFQDAIRRTAEEAQDDGVEIIPMDNAGPAQARGPRPRPNGGGGGRSNGPNAPAPKSYAPKPYGAKPFPPKGDRGDTGRGPPRHARHKKP
jgi:ATP-dependent RNA helicase DeaD